jgi:hypothetical protein
MPSPTDILNRFRKSLLDSKALFAHCISKTDTHTNAGIEAAFLQFVTSWEAFLEDTTLSFLCGGTPISTTSLFQPKFLLGDIEDVRAIIYNGQNYTEWLKTEKLINRYKTFFNVDASNQNRMTLAIRHNITLLKDICTVRNEIAHSSFSTKKNIQVIYDVYNPLRNFSRPAEYLKEFSKDDSTKTNFAYYIDMVELSATQIVE